MVVASILIVEDDKDLSNAYRIILENEKHVVKTAFNGDEALKAIKTFTPDLILLDLLMPIKSGVEFLREYRPPADERAKIVVFTNLENSPEIQEAYNLGANKLVVKSWTAPSGLIKVVNEFLPGPGKPGV